MNTLRVWGGGIYESDEFYNICDDLGIMVIPLLVLNVIGNNRVLQEPSNIFAFVGLLSYTVIYHIRKSVSIGGQLQECDLNITKVDFYLSNLWILSKFSLNI